jgi:hypothetical protein
MYCKVWRPNTSLLKISGAIALHNNKHDLKTSGVTAHDNKHQFSKSIFHLNCQLYAAKYMAKPFCFYSQLRTCSFHSLKYIEIHWQGGIFSFDDSSCQSQTDKAEPHAAYSKQVLT